MAQSIPDKYDFAMDWDIFQIRQRNLASQLDDFKSQAAFSEIADVSPAIVSQILNFHKNMGDSIARRIEKNLGLNRGYMDVIHWGEGIKEIGPDYVTEVSVWDARIEALPIEIKNLVTKLTTDRCVNSLKPATVEVISMMVEELIKKNEA